MFSPTDLEKQYGAHNYSPLAVELTRGEGVHVWDSDGKRYLDMMSAYSAVSFGHSHPYLVDALVQQASRLAITSRAYYSDQLGPFLKRLCEVTGLPRALPMNTGAEGVETAHEAEVLRGIGCDELQGFLFSKPLSPMQLAQWALVQTPA